MIRLIALSLFAALATATTCPPNQVINGRQCTTSCNTDHPGGNFMQQKTGSFEKCIQLCGKTAQCVTAQYNHANGYCYLKSSLNMAVPKSGTDSVVCSSGPLSFTTSTSMMSQPSTTVPPLSTVPPPSISMSTCSATTVTIVQTQPASTVTSVQTQPASTVTSVETQPASTITETDYNSCPVPMSIPPITITPPPSTTTIAIYPTTTDAYGCQAGHTTVLLSTGSDSMTTAQTYVQICSVDYAGNDIATVDSVGGYMNCIAQCPMNEGCLAVVYHTDSDNCYIKDSVDNFNVDSDGEAALLLA